MEEEKTPPPIPLNPSSLGAYIRSSRIVKQLDEYIAKQANAQLEPYNSDGIYMLSEASSLGLENIAQLDFAVKELSEIAVRLVDYISFEKQIYRGFSINMVFYAMTARSNYDTKTDPVSGFDADMLEAYKQIIKYL